VDHAETALASTGCVDCIPRRATIGLGQPDSRRAPEGWTVFEATDLRPGPRQRTPSRMPRPTAGPLQDDGDPALIILACSWSPVYSSSTTWPSTSDTRRSIPAGQLHVMRDDQASPRWVALTSLRQWPGTHDQQWLGSRFPVRLVRKPARRRPRLGRPAPRNRHPLLLAARTISAGPVLECDRRGDRDRRGFRWRVFDSLGNALKAADHLRQA